MQKYILERIASMKSNNVIRFPIEKRINMRGSYNGITSGFQPDDVGSIPSPRSIKTQEEIKLEQERQSYFDYWNPSLDD